MYGFVLLYSVLGMKASVAYSQWRGHSGEKKSSLYAPEMPNKCKIVGTKRLLGLLCPQPLACSQTLPHLRTQGVAGAAVGRQQVPVWLGATTL